MYYRLKVYNSYEYENYNSRSLHELIARDDIVKSYYQYYKKLKFKDNIEYFIECCGKYKIEKSITPL